MSSGFVVSASDREQGVISVYKEQSGWGFARCANRPGDIFVHVYQFVNTPVPLHRFTPHLGDEIEFSVSDHDGMTETSIELSTSGTRLFAVLSGKALLVEGRERRSRGMGDMGSEVWKGVGSHEEQIRSQSACNRCCPSSCACLLSSF